MALQSASVYTDFNGLAELKHRARQDQSGSLDQVAQQFESLMMQMMLQSMRQASLGEGLMDSDQSLFYRDMYDQQIALHLAESGGLGMAEVIKRQLLETQNIVPEQPAGKEFASYLETGNRVAKLRPVNSPPPIDGSEHVKAADTANPAEPSAIGSPGRPGFSTVADFVEQLWPLAQDAAKHFGLDADALLAQAALETGWGKHLIQHGNGSSSHNLFNIKADNRWAGDRVTIPTLEYEQGVAVRKKDAFRAYDSFKESFNDYLQFLQSQPRYRTALAAVKEPEAYFNALQDAGYATDPRYAEKILGVMRGSEMQAALQQVKDAETRTVKL